MLSASSTGFINLCKDLSFLQVGLLQRAENPLTIANQALTLLQRYSAGGEEGDEVFQPSASAGLTSESLPYVPVFLRSCATLLKKVPEQKSVELLENLESVHRVAKQYIEERCGDVNEACTVLGAVLQLNDLQRRCYSPSLAPFPSSTERASLAFRNKIPSSSPSSSSCSFSNLLRPSYAHAHHQWHQQTTKVHTLSVLSLLKGTAAVHAEGFHFPALNPDQRGLLPVKHRVQMEAKMQRCAGAREILQSLRYMQLNRLDAGMCLTVLAELGFYDAEVCNMACEVLNSAHSMVTSQQLSQIMFSLGILQHRHVYQRFFSSLLNPKQCDAEGIRQHVMGLAMLQQPPHSEKQLMDGIFLHALRGANQEKERKQQRRRNRSQAHEPKRLGSDPRFPNIHTERSSFGAVNGDRSNRGTEFLPHSPSSRSPLSSYSSSSTCYILPYAWYVDVGYSLSCLEISHHKFKLLTARHCRGVLPKMSTSDRCKFLYAMGPVTSDPTVPSEVKESWDQKAGKAFQVAVKMLENIELSEGPQVMHALRYCGVTEHPRLPPPHLLSNAMTEKEKRENPVEVLLRTWATTPKEYVIHLAEQIDTEQLLSCSAPYAEDSAAKQLARVVTTLAKACPSPSPKDQYRFASLCATIEHHVKAFSVEELLTILKGLQILSLAPYYDETVQQLVDELWRKREEMTEAQVEVGGTLLLELGDEKKAEWLKEKSINK